MNTIKGLALNIEVSYDTFDGMEQTYRDEGISVGPEKLRISGNEIELSIGYSDLIIGHRIGQGACSNVNVATHKVTGQSYAVKMFNVYDHRQAEQLRKEIVMLTKLNECDALISLEGVFHHEGSVGVVLEYMDKGSLEYFSRIKMPLSEPLLASISYQILWGLGYLHFEKKLHRDVKPANVLFNSIGFVKLTDFGISKELESTDSMSNTAIGTCKYMSPERLLGQRYDSSGDIWAVGIMMLELYNQKYPFEDSVSSPLELLDALETFDLNDYTYGMPEDMQSLIASMLYRNQSERATANDLVEYQWFNNCGIVDLQSAHEVMYDWLCQHDELQESYIAPSKYTNDPNSRRLQANCKAEFENNYVDDYADEIQYRGDFTTGSTSDSVDSNVMAISIEKIGNYNHSSNTYKGEKLVTEKYAK